MFGRNRIPELADAPGSLDEARSRLLLRVYGAEHSGVSRLEAAASGAEEGLPAVRQITPELSVGAVVEVSAGYMKVSAATLQNWACTLDDLIEVVRGRTSGHEFTASGLGEATILIEDDVYSGAVWVMPQMAASLPINGAPLAWALGRGRTLVTGADDPEGLTIVAGVIQQLLQDGERVESVTPHSLGDLGWEPVGWPTLPDYLDEVITRLHKSQVYARQAEPLRAALNDGGHVNVNEYAVVRQRGGGHPRAVTNWVQDVTAAIPVVDEVELVRADGASLRVPWPALVEQANDLLEPVTDLPPRYLTRGFPTDAMVAAALGRAPDK